MVVCEPGSKRIWSWEDDSAEGTESVCEERRTENCRSQSRRLISCDATAARRTWDEVRASRDTGYLEEERKENLER